MKKLSNLNNLSLLALALLVTFGACSSVNNDVEAISAEDVDLAAHIVTTSIADDESGMMSSLYDAFSDVSSEGISYGSTDARFKPDPDRGNDGRGRERNYTYSYDPETGIHSLDYSRSVENGAFSKSIDVNQAIIFTDLEGGFIEFPRQDKENIEAIAYSGTKAGQHTGKFRSSSFSKADDFRLAGIHSTSSLLTLSGTHTGTGNAAGVTRDSVEASRSYNVDLEFTNIEVNKDTVKAHGSLEFAVSGTITYSVTMNKTIDGVPEETVMEGTIDLSEDGTALMRFNKLPNTIRFALGDGERRDSNTDRRGGN
ncbi:MAG: hypothetical protein JJ895_14760 [Balneolaceae bacterium]|nr:hypothetical protein [Balneolaceae bacterium]